MRFPAPQGEPVMVSGRTEAFELFKAYLGTTLAFSILLNRQSSFSIAQAAVIAALTAGAGFVIHELAHRVVARAFGVQARFWANNLMLLLAIIGAFAGFLFAAPGPSGIVVICLSAKAVWWQRRALSPTCCWRSCFSPARTSPGRGMHRLWSCLG